MKTRLWKTSALALGLATFVACSDDDNNNANSTTVDDAGPTADAAGDVGTDPTDAGGPVEIDPGLRGFVPAQSGVEATGLPTGDVPAGEARAFAVRGDDHGFTGIWAHCKDGDVRIANEAIDVCISGVKSNRFEMFSGGMIVDVRKTGFEGDDIFDITKPRAQFNVPLAETVEVVRDGTDGGPAVVRVTGVDTPVAYLVGALGASVLRSSKLKMVTEYRLFPGDTHVEIFTEATNESGGNRTYALGDWIALGDGSAVFRPEAGFDLEQTSEFSWVSGFADGRSYGMVVPEPILAERLPIASIPWVISNAGTSTTEDGESKSFFRYLVVGDSDPESIRLQAGELGAVELPETTQTVRVVDSAGNPLAGRTVEIRDGEVPVTAVVTDEDGRASFRAEPKDYRVLAEVIPGEAAFDQEVSFDGESEVTLAQGGTIRVTVDASAGGSSGTARVTLAGPGRVDAVALHGDGSWNVAPGDWRVVVQRGPEWSFVAEDVTVVAGQEVEVTAVLTPTMNTDGWIGADFHQHMEPSIDSEVTVADRVLDNVAHGVEFVAPTDHEAVTDLQPYITEFGLGDELGTFPGVEVSPARTHIGIYPLTYEAAERGRGSIPLAVLNEEGEAVQRTIPEIVQIARTLPSDPIIQLNHARNGSGLLADADFDPEADPETFLGPNFTLDFDVMELINRKDDVCVLFRDFSGLWNAGYTPTGIGNSDSHGIWGGVGQPRTWLHIAGPVANVTADDIRSAMLEHRATVGANAFIDFADGMLPGDTVVSSPGNAVDFHVRVQSATFASASVLLTVANGVVIDRRDITPASNILDFDEVVSFSFDEDTWVSFFVWGPRPLGDVSYGHPVMAFTNPVLVDVDGDANSDGEPWEAPGFGPLDLSNFDNNGYCSF